MNKELKFFRGFTQLTTSEETIIQELFEGLDDGLVWAETVMNDSKYLNKTQREILKLYVEMNTKFANDLILSTGNSKEIERRLHESGGFIQSVTTLQEREINM